VLEGDQSAINVYAAEGTGGYSQWMKFKDYAGYYSKIMGADDGAMYFQNKANTWNFIPSGAAAESVTLASGTLILGTPDLVTPLAGTGTVFNTNAIAINMGGAASQLSFGAASSTSTFKGSINATGSIFNNGPISTTGYVSAASGYRLTSSAVNAQTGTTYTLLSTDDGRIITMNNGSSITVTVPTGLNIGFNTTVIQLGAGQVTFATGVGSPTLNSYGSAQKITGQYGAASIISYASNSYNLAGTLST